MTHGYGLSWGIPDRGSEKGSGTKGLAGREGDSLV